jgi:hypothetical protein
MRPPRRGAAGRLRRALRRDDGIASLEIVMLFPVLLLLLFAIIQISFWYYAREAALAAAQEGVRAGRWQGSGGVGAGITAADDYLGTHTGHVITGSAYDDGSDPQQIRIVVRGTSFSLFPFWRIDVAQHASGPVERFTSVVNP